MLTHLQFQFLSGFFKISCYENDSYALKVKLNITIL